MQKKSIIKLSKLAVPLHQEVGLKGKKKQLLEMIFKEIGIE